MGRILPPVTGIRYKRSFYCRFDLNGSFIEFQKVVLKSVDDEYPLETIFIWTPIGSDKTNVMLRNIGQLIHFPKDMAPLMNRLMKKVQDKDLKKLKRILENS